MESITRIASFFNPLSAQQHGLADFKELKGSQKVMILAATLFAALLSILFFRLGGMAVFKKLTHHFSVIISQDNPLFSSQSPTGQPILSPSFSPSPNSEIEGNPVTFLPVNALLTDTEVKEALKKWRDDPNVQGDKIKAYELILSAFESKSKKLSLIGLKLSHLPSVISQLTQLQELYLRVNQLQTLPSTIGNLTQLQTLLLNDNKLQSLPNTIGNLTQLQTLHFSDNQVQTLPSTIGNLTQLQKLFLFLERFHSKEGEVLYM